MEPYSQPDIPDLVSGSMSIDAEELLRLNNRLAAAEKAINLLLDILSIAVVATAVYLLWPYVQEAIDKYSTKGEIPGVQS
jgi:hypothetical protein